MSFKNSSSFVEERSEKKRVLVAMSGGVDSSVAAALLVEQGFDVIGVTMQVWDYSASNQLEKKGSCCSPSDVEDARAVADHLRIPFYVLDCESKFQTNVIDNFMDSYFEGETPLPCVQCNTHLKFDHLFIKMKELKCHFLATGHYAQIKSSPVHLVESSSFRDSKNRGKGKKSVFTKNREKVSSLRPMVLTSSDDFKDQTYFLFTLKPEVLPFLKFPVGSWTKERVREYARKKSLPVAFKKDSTGLCFVGKQSYSNFIQERLSQSSYLRKSNVSGLFRKHPEGDILGEHRGIHFFTYGQRRGLGLSSPTPLYVIRIDPESKTVWLGEEKCLYADEAWVREAHFLGDFSFQEKLSVKIRFSHKGSLATLRQEASLLHLKFDEPQKAITPGQAAVFYRGSQLLGGGWIVRRETKTHGNCIQAQQSKILN